jgi:hypothetical protein
VALFEESEFTQAWEPEFAETIDEESVIADEV